MDINSPRYERCRNLFGENYSDITHAKILLLGVGGVGSYALDCLWRTGIHNITIIDFDTYEESNQNRQMGSDNAVGQIKVFSLANKYEGVTPIHLHITPEWVETFDFSSFDIVLDAIDDIPAKVAIAKKCYSKLISSMGSAKKLDPSQMEFTSIWKTYGDPFAKKFRNELKKQRFNRNFKVLFSPETPHCKPKGSFVGVTGAFGLGLCSHAITTLLKNKK